MNTAGHQTSVDALFSRAGGMRMKRISLMILFILLLVGAREVQCQRGAPARTGGNNIVYGDVKVDEGEQGVLKPISLDVLLYTEAGNLVSRQTVQSNGRYRFMNLTEGRYQIVVEVENSEIARFPVDFSSPLKGEIRQDIEFQWREGSGGNRAGVVSAADNYNRAGKNVGIFSKATDAAEKKHYDQAVFLLRQIVETDPKDFPAWEQLGRIHFIQKNYDEAEKAYSAALKAHPDYALVLISLGRLRLAQKNFDGAVEVLSQAVKVQPDSPQANYFLGEAYLQLKKGSKAVGYLYAALKLDPVGMADAHLLLGALYHGAGMKDKAAAEYEQYLKKKPNDPEKKTLEQYISTNKKQ
jgi:tetratricopeptide (TPR) repeat protein